MSTQPPERPPTRPDRPQGPGTPGPAPKPWSRWVTVIVIAAIAVVLFMTAVGSNDTSKVSLSYSKFTNAGERGQRHQDRLRPEQRQDQRCSSSEPIKGRTQFTSAGPNNNLTDNDLADLRKKGVQINYVREGSNPWLPILIYLLPIAALIGFFVWMNRRAQGQMGAVMNIGKSQRQGPRRREAPDHVRRRRRLRAGEGGDQGGRRLPEEPGQVQGDRCAHPARRAPRRPSGHRQDAHRTGRRR